jgi:uncharacterized protein (DUF58 family)
MQTTLHFIDPALMARIADLDLLARAIVEGFMAGMHRSPHSGQSIEFAQYRPYVQGDDPRTIDWKLYARTDRLHVKQYQEETNLRCSLLFDVSGSMDYGSAAMTKFQYARVLVASLAVMLNKQTDAVGLIAYHENRAVHIPPRSDPHHLRRLLVELQNLKPSGKTDTAGTLQFLGDVIDPRGMVILVSDLLHPAEQMIEHLKSLRALRHDVLVFQISDPAEQTFPFEFASTFIDAEDGVERFAIPSVVREEYLENRRRHLASIRRECLGAEIDLVEFATNEPLDRALHHFIHRRSHALQTSSLKRARRAGGGSR